jgi:OOP family OmpA-OmpF porin
MVSQRKKLVLSGVYASLLLAGAASVSAAEQATGLYVAPSVGYQYFDSERFEDQLGVEGLENDVSYGLGLGYNWGRWAAELKYDQVNTETKVPSTVDALDVDFKHWHLDLLHFFNEEKNWTPYLALGLGHGKYEIDAAEDDRQTFANAGVGIVKALSKHIDLRSELRAQYSFDEEMTDALFNIALVYNFGSAPEPKPEPAPAPAPAPAPVDSDGDGVFDDKDQCPDTARGAKVDEVGCYIILKETKTFRLDVKFANASSAIEADARSSIRDLATFLTEYPNTDVVVEGHTDSNGSDAYNQRLSEARAKAVADALVNQYGIDARRVTSVGYGESRPEASNATAEGRQQNRRVVAVVKASVEKRAEK